MAGPAAPSGASSASGVTATYVVTLRSPGGDANDRVAVVPLARRLAGALDGRVLRTYTHVLDGFSASLTTAAADTLRRDPRVASVRRDVTVRVADQTQSGATWGLDRSDQRGGPLDGRYTYPTRAGSGAHVYVVDTGLAAGHSEFSGRVGTGVNFVPSGILFPTVDPSDWADCNGHGTHVASTASGTRWGIAKRATVHAVRALGCDGYGDGSDILAALDWVLATHQSPAVVNLSLSTEASPEVNLAVRSLVDNGISVVVAAGNEAADACLSSPASEPAVLTVAAIDSTDNRSVFSNAGPCVDLFAPGTDITGADFHSTSGSTVISGTSMASPHVAGAVAVVRAANPGLTATQAQVQVLQQATTGAVGSSAGAPNRLLFVSGDDPPKARYRVTCRRLRCTFNARRSSDDKRITKYRWTFPGGDVKRGRIVHRRFAKPGTKTVELRVVDTRDQRSTVAKRFKVRRAR